jgi:hypothetical protein
LAVYGFRSTFRDWAAEATAYPKHVVEQALAYTIGNAVEAAYRRGDLFAKRAALMDDWARIWRGRRRRWCRCAPPQHGSGAARPRYKTCGRLAPIWPTVGRKGRHCDPDDGPGSGR